MYTVRFDFCLLTNAIQLAIHTTPALCVHASCEVVAAGIAVQRHDDILSINLAMTHLKLI